MRHTAYSTLHTAHSTLSAWTVLKVLNICLNSLPAQRATSCHFLLPHALALPLTSSPTGLVDGNEKLLRQVLDQFVSKTTATIEDIKNIIHEAVKNPSEPQEKDQLPGGQLRRGWEPWREKLRFEAQSVASAASTLGAAVLSMNSLDVETKVLEDESAVDIQEAVDVMAASFVAIKNVIESMTGQVRHDRLECRSIY